MKLVTYEGGSGVGARAGVLVGEVVLDLVRGVAHMEGPPGAPPSPLAKALEERGVLGFIEHAESARPAAEHLVERYTSGALPPTLTKSLGEIALLSPLPRPPSMRDGYAFRQHVETARRNRGLEMIPEFDLFPVFYFTNHQAVIGPGELRVQPLHLDKLDFELEAAVVIGKRARNLSASSADEAIFGYTIMNDFSARTLQMEEMKLSLGPAKGKDFATGLGPYLVTRDELQPYAQSTLRGDVHDLAMRAFVNGKQVSAGNVRDMAFTFAQIIERASYGVTLFPGDVIGSGTCGTGCFLELNGSKVTDNQWLRPGDVVALEIDELGRLEHSVVLEPS